MKIKSKLGKLFLYVNDIKVAMQVILPASFLFLHCDTPTPSQAHYSFCYKQEQWISSDAEQNTCLAGSHKVVGQNGKIILKLEIFMTP